MNNIETTRRAPRHTSKSLESAELRRLELDMALLEAEASADPILKTMLAAARACRDRLLRERADA